MSWLSSRSSYCYGLYYSSLHGEAFIDIFFKLHKLKLGTLSDSLAMTSFEKPVPKGLKSNNERMILDDKSYLDRIPSWEHCDHPEMGMKANVMDEIEKFNTTHGQRINESLVCDSPGHTLIAWKALKKPKEKGPHKV